MSSMHVYQPETAVAEVECAAPARGGDDLPREHALPDERFLPDERAHREASGTAPSGVVSSEGDAAAGDIAAREGFDPAAPASDTASRERLASEVVPSRVVAHGALSNELAGASLGAQAPGAASAAVSGAPVGSDAAHEAPSSAASRAPVLQAPASTPASASAADWVSRELHREVLERFVPRAARVLELNPGRGTFTEVLHRLGCKVSLCAASPDELARVHGRAAAHGFTDSIEASHQLGIAALDGIADASFDVVVAYHAALSHALERRDRALSECMRVLRPRGLLVLSVGSLWGTLHRVLPAVLARDLVQSRAIIRSGNAPLELLQGPLPASADFPALPNSSSAGPASVHGQSNAPAQSHLFRAAELEAFLRRGGLELLHLSASSALSTGVALPSGGDASTWSALLEYERAACVERGYLDSGTDLIAVCRR